MVRLIGLDASRMVRYGRHLIVLITNQNGLRTATDKNINKHRTWKTKIEAIAQSVCHILLASGTQTNADYLLL